MMLSCLRKNFKWVKKVLLFISKLRLLPDKLKSTWLGPLVVTSVHPHDDVEIQSLSTNKIIKVNGHMLKYFRDGDSINFIEEITLEDP